MKDNNSNLYDIFLDYSYSKLKKLFRNAKSKRKLKFL